jgi:multiple sugar transport system ATP-binding protein
MSIDVATKSADVRLVGLSKTFGKDVVAVDIDEMVIPAGEFVTLLGPSGCGKTTTLKLIAGLERPTRGSIYFGNQRVTDLVPGRRDIAMVFQNYALYPHMNVRRNLEYGLKKHKVPRAERARRIAWVSDMLQMPDLLSRKPRELSGGQQQRVALGRAMVREPSAFLLDEPLSNLDAKLRQIMRVELIRLHHTIRATMIYVTHDQVEAMSMSQRIAVMQDGKVQQYADPATVYNNPANKFVAGFIGNPSMNFVDGALVSGETGLRFVALEMDTPLPDGVTARMIGNDESNVILGIRPEDVVLNHDQGDGSPKFQGRVVVVESLGPETIITLETAFGSMIVRESGTSDIEFDQQITFSLNTDRMHLFNAASGKSLLHTSESGHARRRQRDPGAAPQSLVQPARL